MKKQVVTLPYLMATVLFVTCLLLANTAEIKLIFVGPLVLTAGILIFPITYIVNDVLAEVYGFKRARFSIFLGFAMNLLMVTYYSVVVALPSPSFFENQSAVAAVLGNTPRLLIASLLAYLVGSTVNAKILVFMRDRAKVGKGLFNRCVTSTLGGELLDSLIFIPIAFLGQMPVNEMILMIFTQAAFKTGYEILAYPVTRVVIKAVKKIEAEA